MPKRRSPTVRSDLGPTIEELNHLYAKLSPEERDELLQCLLIAARSGREAMIKVLEDLLLCHAMEEMLGEPLGADEAPP